jgi:hypothetical protein
MSARVPPVWSDPAHRVNFSVYDSNAKRPTRSRHGGSLYPAIRPRIKFKQVCHRLPAVSVPAYDIETTSYGCGACMMNVQGKGGPFLPAVSRWIVFKEVFRPAKSSGNVYFPVYFGNGDLRSSFLHGSCLLPTALPLSITGCEQENRRKDGGDRECEQREIRLDGDFRIHNRVFHSASNRLPK